MKLTTIKAKPGKGGGKLKTDRVVITPAKNGFTVSHHKRPIKPNPQMPFDSPPPEETVHENADSMLDRVGQIFKGGNKPDDAGAPPEPEPESEDTE